MSLIKSLIQWLLDSRTTPAQAANASIPLYSKTPQYVQETKTEEDYSAVAPFDCFVTANVNSAQTSTSRLCSYGIKVNGVNINRSNAYFPTGSVWFDKGAFVKKGDLITVSFNPWNETMIETQFTIFFHKLIGGGYNNLVRRAQSCLKPSFNYLPRSFCKASILTLLTSVGRVSTHRAKLSQEKRKGVMLHLSVVGQFFSSTPQQTTLGSRWRTLIERRFIALTQSAIAKQYLSQCRRATRLKSILEPTTKAQHLLSLFATNRLSNLLTIGGALC